jgi:pimeloyl-ACP methyl ester carboxylesterase
MPDFALRRRAFLTGAAASVAILGLPAFAQQSDLFTPFTSRVPDEALADLKKRLDAVRWPEEATEPGFAQGPPLDSMHRLTDYWRGNYNWRQTEKRLNAWPQFKTEIDELGIHFLHVRSRHQNALPIILTHGWPSTVLLFQKVMEPLTDPTAYGGNTKDAFHVVIPSLPGFGFSDKPKEPGWNAERTARAWAELMRRLGYDRYVAQGGDWGAFVTTALAQQKPKGLKAIHLNFAQTIPNEIPEKLEPDQKKAVEAYKKFQESGFAYGMLQATKPQLAGYLLADSPMAQAAWLYDIFDGGTGATGKPEDLIPIDDMLDEITLYWLSNSSASSARFYREQAAILKGRNNPGIVELPVGVSVFPNDLPPARSWAPLVYPNLFHWNELDRGGHFAQLEVPNLFVAELRKCFKSLR